MNLLASARSSRKSAKALCDHRIETPWPPSGVGGSGFEPAGPQPSKLNPVAMGREAYAWGSRMDQVVLEIRSCPLSARDGQFAQSDCVVATLFFIIGLALNVTTLCLGIRISAPVVGLRPLRGRFVRTTKIPKPEIFTGSPLSRKALMISNVPSTRLVASSFETCAFLQSWLTISAFVVVISARRSTRHAVRS